MIFGRFQFRCGILKLSYAVDVNQERGGAEGQGVAVPDNDVCIIA